MITATRHAGCPRLSELLKTPCLPGASRRGGDAPPRSLPVDVLAGYRVAPATVPGRRPGGGRNTTKEGPGRPSDRSPPRRPRDRPRCLLSARALPSPAIASQGWPPAASPVLDFAVT